MDKHKPVSMSITVISRNICS